MKRENRNKLVAVEQSLREAHRNLGELQDGVDFRQEVSLWAKMSLAKTRVWEATEVINRALNRKTKPL